MRHRSPPKPDTINRWLTRLAECKEGKLHWHPEWVKMSYDHGMNLRAWECTAGAERETIEEEGGTTPTMNRRNEQIFVRGGVQN